MSPPRKKPSIRDVARVAGVSIATVSHVFSGKKPVREELAKRVRHAANELDYQVDRAASQLRSGRGHVIAVIIPDLEDLFLSRFLSLIEQHAQNAGFEVIVACSRNDPTIESSRLRALLGWRPAGIVAVPCGDSIPEELLAVFPDTPVVGADRIEPGKAPFDTVTVDNYRAGYEVGQHLAARRVDGILMVTATLGLFNARERIRGAKDALAADGAVAVLETSSDPADAAAQLAEWLKTHKTPGAIVGLTNLMTLATLSALAECGLSAPDDTLLVGFHDSLWMTARRVSVTTVVQPVDEVARCVWDLLELRLRGGDTPIQSIILPPELVERTSTAVASG